MFSTLVAVEDYLQGLVPKTFHMQFTAERGIARTREYLRLLGSPQNKLKVVHIAGTSGKGSTSYMISGLLISQGFKVGLHLSPHLLDIRERTEINNTLLEEKKYCSYFRDIISAIEKMKQSAFGVLTYFEALAGFTFYVFEKEKVDYAVMETGMGGKYDGTNVVDRADKLSVVTKIGFDHTKILGNTLTLIAHQKAMICVDGGELITGKQSPTAAKEIEKVVKEKKGHLSRVSERHSGLSRIRSWSRLHQRWIPPQDDDGQAWKWSGELGLLGEYQKENASLALTTLLHLGKRDGFTVDMNSVRSVLKDIKFKGRFDVIQKKQGIIILDGAHNAQKMKALLKSVHTAYPQKKFTFVIAFKMGKDYKKMLAYIIPFAHKIVITRIFSESQDLIHHSVSPENIMHELTRLGYTNTEIQLKSSEIIAIIKNETDSTIVTGSLYLLGDIYTLL